VWGAKVHPKDLRWLRGPTRAVAAKSAGEAKIGRRTPAPVSPHEPYVFFRAKSRRRKTWVERPKFCRSQLVTAFLGTASSACRTSASPGWPGSLPAPHHCGETCLRGVPFQRLACRNSIPALRCFPTRTSPSLRVPRTCVRRPHVARHHRRASPLLSCPHDRSIFGQGRRVHPMSPNSLDRGFCTSLASPYRGAVSPGNWPPRVTCFDWAI